MHEENNALKIAATSEQQIAVLDLVLRNDSEFNRLPYSGSFEFRVGANVINQSPRPDGRRELPTPNPAPGRGSPLRRTGSGSGAERLCLPQALERTGGRWRIKGSLRRATPALDPSPTTNSGCLITHSNFKRGPILLTCPCLILRVRHSVRRGRFRMISDREISRMATPASKFVESGTVSGAGFCPHSRGISIVFISVFSAGICRNTEISDKTTNNARRLSFR